MVLQISIRCKRFTTDLTSERLQLGVDEFVIDEFGSTGVCFMTILKSTLVSFWTMFRG